MVRYFLLLREHQCTTGNLIYSDRISATEFNVQWTDGTVKSIDPQKPFRKTKHFRSIPFDLLIGCLIFVRNHFDIQRINVTRWNIILEKCGVDTVSCMH